MSVNVCDSETTPLHVVFEEVCKDAKVGACERYVYKQTKSLVCVMREEGVGFLTQI